MTRPLHVGAAVLAVSIVVMAVAPTAAAAAQRVEIVVGPGEEVRTLGEALSRARDGDRIRLLPGVYAESDLLVDRSVEIVGEGLPVIDGQGKAGILRIHANDVVLRGLLLRNSGVSFVEDHAAVEIEGATGCRVEDNVLENNFFGIVLARVRGCRVVGNRIEARGGRETSSGNGIHLWYSSNVQIRDNEVRGHRDGIYLEFSEAADIRSNRVSENLRYGLHFMFSDRTRVRDNLFTRNGAGVAVMYTKRVEIADNRFVDNWGPTSYGLLLKDITDSTITGNLVRRNTVGLFAEGSDRIQIRRNRFEANGWAVRIWASSRDNVFSDNDFIDNTFEVTTNSRHDHNRFHGNYWSQYRGFDLSGDGIGDVPHRPVRLFSLIIERNPVALVLLRSLFVDLLDLAERVLPVLTPEGLVDEAPRMEEIRS